MDGGRTGIDCPEVRPLDKRWIGAAAVAAALAARCLFPAGAAAAETWLLGPDGNRVAAAFAALEAAMGDGVGQAVTAFCQEMTGRGGA